MYRPAKEYYERALILEPENFDSFFRLSEVYTHEQNFDKAEFYLKKSILVNPNDIVALGILATLYLLILHDYECADIYAKRAFEIEPENDFIVDIMDLCNTYLIRYNETEDYFEACLNDNLGEQ